MPRLLTSFVALAVTLAPALAQPAVSLLTDNGYPTSGTLNLVSTLQAVSTRKGQTFHFGSTYDTYDANQSWFTSVFSTFYKHVVSENGCKWDATEPSQGTSSLTECLACQSFATTNGDTFRGHNTFWHSQTPSWLPGSFSASQVVNTIIPQHVQQEIQGMGASITSWDVVNEVVGDGVSNGMTPLQCVQNKKVWPTVTSDGSSTALVTDLSFIYAAFKTAFTYAGSSTRLAINEYNTGGQDAKTACIISLIQNIQNNTAIPFNRLAVGFQSHLTASTGGFYTKSALATTFSTLAALGVESMITELDISLNSNNQANLRYQAAIWGDYLDACLYAANCNEFINWDPRDDLSWRGTSAAATLFDGNGNPKLAAYEVAARLANYAAGNAEPCATASGTSVCTITGSGPGTGTGSGTTTVSKTTSVGSTSVSTPGGGPTGCTSALYGQCGGMGWTGCTSCASGSTCKYSNAYYSQCLA
ncbi:Beta-xylanase [Mycena indigotica]|uniref:Beta-xylanase n=1 Tax=Mycena indigotica TaxID=2126181 RepID=A0A8H6W313_9AGAR|nr:Beta-xylanase [Mycena indigotica]KAF7297504.1 Beta-xylanase [Mycena indigotica]